MKEKYLINNSLRFLKYFFGAFGVLPFSLLLLFIFTGGENKEVEKVFLYISFIIFIVCSLVVLMLSALPNYYLSLSNGNINIPVSSFFKGNNEMLKFKLTDIASVNVEPSFDSGSSLIIIINSISEINNKNVAQVGEAIVETKNKQTRISINSLNRNYAEKWLNKLKA